MNRSTAFYGCIYNDEYQPDTYREIVERQFRVCAARAKRDRYDIAAWYFDVLIENPIAKFEVEAFVQAVGASISPMQRRP